MLGAGGPRLWKGVADPAGSSGCWPIGCPGFKQVLHLSGSVGVHVLGADRSIRGEFCEFGEDLEMLFVGMLRNKQEEQQPDRLTIRRIKRNAGRHADDRCNGVTQSLDAASLAGHAFAQPC